MNSQIEQRDFEALMEHLGIVPGMITKPNPPDFTIEIDGRKIGIEHTLGVFEEVARGLQLQRSERPYASLNLTSLFDRERRRPSIEIRGNITHPTNPCVRWMPLTESCERWVQKIAKAVNRKRAILNKAHYHPCDENWLLVVDYPAWLDNMTTRMILSPLRQGLIKNNHGLGDFDRIYIKSGDVWLHWKNGNLEWHQEKVSPKSSPAEW